MSTDEVRFLESQLAAAESSIQMVRKIIAGIPDSRRTLTVQTLVKQIEEALGGDQ